MDDVQQMIINEVKRLERVVEKRVVEIEGYAIGLVHDLGMHGIDEVRPGAFARSWPSHLSIADSLANRHHEAQTFGRNHYWDALGDLYVELRARK